MASTLEFVTYVTDQLALAGTITWKRMFGEVGLYCDQVFFAVICDDQLFIKITNAAIMFSNVDWIGVPRSFKAGISAMLASMPPLREQVWILHSMRSVMLRSSKAFSSYYIFLPLCFLYSNLYYM